MRSLFPQTSRHRYPGFGWAPIAITGGICIIGVDRLLFIDGIQYIDWLRSAAAAVQTCFHSGAAALFYYQGESTLPQDRRVS